MPELANDVLEQIQDEEVGINTAMKTAKVLGRQYVDLGAEIVQMVLQLPARTLRNWDGLCRLAEAGRVESLHKAREWFLERVDGRIGLLREALQLAKSSAEMTGQDNPKIPLIEQSLTDLEGFKADLFPKWNTLEDLENIILDRHSLTEEELRTVRATLPPFHAQWYAENDKPF